MKSDKAVVSVYVRAFKTLSVVEQKAVLAQVLRMRRWRKDLVDIAIAESRVRDGSRPFRSFLAQAKK